MNIRNLLPVLAACLVLAGCAPDVGESAAAAAQTLAGADGRPTDGVLDLFTAGSARYVALASRAGGGQGTLVSIESVLEHGTPDTASAGLIRGGEPDATVFFVPDGHSNRIDLALSGVTFLGLREPSYPSTW